MSRFFRTGWFNEIGLKTFFTNSLVITQNCFGGLIKQIRVTIWIKTSITTPPACVIGSTESFETTGSQEWFIQESDGTSLGCECWDSNGALLYTLLTFAAMLFHWVFLLYHTLQKFYHTVLNWSEELIWLASEDIVWKVNPFCFLSLMDELVPQFCFRWTNIWRGSSCKSPSRLPSATPLSVSYRYMIVLYNVNGSARFLIRLLYYPFS